MRTKLTDLTIQSLKLGLPQQTYWDLLLPAFGVRVGSRTKTFIVMRTKARKRLVLGRWPAMRLSEARERARRLLEHSSAASSLNATTPAAVSEYLSTLQTRPRTAAEYARLLNRHLIPYAGTKSLSAISPADVLAITDTLSHAPTECRHAHAALKTFFNWCVPRYLPASPMLGLKSPAKPNKRARILSIHELKAIWHAAPETDFGRVIRLCILTALRRSEVFAIQPSWTSPTILTVPAVIAKNHREHPLPLTDQMRRYLAHAPFKSFNWAKQKANLDRDSKVQGWVLHDLRRTAASIMAAPPISAPPHLIERLLNHISGSGTALQHTYQRYQYEPELRDLMQRYNDHICDGIQ